MYVYPRDRSVLSQSQQIPMCLEEGLETVVTVQLQTFIGLASALGSFLFGLIVLSRSQQCLISKQYLLQASMLGIGKKLISIMNSISISISILKFDIGTGRYWGLNMIGNTFGIFFWFFFVYINNGLENSTKFSSAIQSYQSRSAFVWEKNDW